MDFDFSEEQRLLDETVRRLVKDEYDIPKRKTRMESADGFSRDLWARFAEIGFPTRRSEAWRSACAKAGPKCPARTRSKGGRPKGVSQGCSKGLSFGFVMVSPQGSAKRVRV